MCITKSEDFKKYFWMQILPLTESMSMLVTSIFWNALLLKTFLAVSLILQPIFTKDIKNKVTEVINMLSILGKA